jgi:FixJ family two-component response regulator
MPSRSPLWSIARAHEAPALVAVIDDNPDVCDLIRDLLSTVGLQVDTFGSTQAFMGEADPGAMSCLVIDVRLPGKNGLEFFEELKRAQVRVPVVFISGYGDIPMAVRAMKGGAVEFLCKPFAAQDLLDAVQRGIEQDRRRRDHEAPAQALRARMVMLTRRERQVMAQVVSGAPNKEIAQALRISEVTVKAHRRQVMSKMAAATFADLVRMSVLLGLDERGGQPAADPHQSAIRSIP